MKALALKNRARAAAEVLLFISLLIAAVLIAADKRYSDTVLSGIMLWAAAVLPSLFPYFFITAALSSLSVTEKLAAKLSPFTRKVFNTGGITGYAFLMSLISGYPLGAKLVADLKENGLLSRAESVRAAAFCSTSSPMFMISSVGSIMFKSAEFGLCLFLCHLLSAFAVGFIFSFYKRGEHPKACPPGGSPCSPRTKPCPARRSAPSFPWTRKGRGVGAGRRESRGRAFGSFVPGPRKGRGVGAEGGKGPHT